MLGQLVIEYSKSYSIKAGFADNNTGIILSGKDIDVGVSGTTATNRHSAIVSFARLLAQCPGTCVTACQLQNTFEKARTNREKILVVCSAQFNENLDHQLRDPSSSW